MLLLHWVLCGELFGGGSVRLPAANAADSCQWPTVVSFRAGDVKCTGTLVHPEVVLTAAHCLLGGTPDRVAFGEVSSPSEQRVDVERCWSRPFADGDGPGEDLAACRLATPVLHVPITPILNPCETAEAVVAGADVTLVGFGIPSNDGVFGTKRYAFTRVGGSPRDDGTFVAGDTMVNGCFGDSGGPAFVRMPGGTWHVAGVLVLGPACGDGPSRWLAPSTHLAWLEAAVERDLSPCRDADGTWTAGPDCLVASDPLAISNAWAEWCDGAREMPRDACATASPDPGTTGDCSGAIDTSDECHGGTSSGSPHDDGSSGTAAHDPGAREGGCRFGSSAPSRAMAFMGLALFGARRRARVRVRARARSRLLQNAPRFSAAG